MPEKYQQEIEEILGRIEERPLQDTKSRGRGPTALVPKVLRRLLGGRRLRLSPGRIMMGSLALLLVALLLRASMPGLVAPLAWAAVVTFILGYALFFIHPYPVYEKRWRGQIIENSPQWWDRFLIWLKGH